MLTGLNINHNKTDCMINDPNKLYIEGNHVREIDQFRYLGSNIKLDGTSNLDARKRICSGRRKISILTEHRNNKQKQNSNL